MASGAGSNVGTFVGIFVKMPPQPASILSCAIPLSTWANENGYNRDAIERQLAHSPDDKIRAIYNRSEFIEQRRVMLADYANWLMPY